MKRGILWPRPPRCPMEVYTNSSIASQALRRVSQAVRRVVASARFERRGGLFSLGLLLLRAICWQGCHASAMDSVFAKSEALLKALFNAIANTYGERQELLLGKCTVPSMPTPGGCRGASWGQASNDSAFLAWLPPHLLISAGPTEFQQYFLQCDGLVDSSGTVTPATIQQLYAEVCPAGAEGLELNHFFDALVKVAALKNPKSEWWRSRRERLKKHSLVSSRSASCTTHPLSLQEHAKMHMPSSSQPTSAATTMPSWPSTALLRRLSRADMAGRQGTEALCLVEAV